jgi:hypothetical protein
MNAFLANPNIVNNQLFAHSQSTKDRIQQALDAGYEITIHEAPITQDGWTGAGFSVIDPNTGAGGYLIEGGANGGSLIFPGMILALLTVLAFFFVSSGFLVVIAGVAGLISHVLLSLASSGSAVELFEYKASRFLMLFRALAIGGILAGGLISFPALFLLTLMFSVVSTISTFVLVIW